MSSRRVTVFGGTGFLGRRIVRYLHDADFAIRIASRHPDRGRSLFSRDGSGIDSFHADVNHDDSVASAVRGAWAVVKAVSLYVEHTQCTFQSVLHAIKSQRQAGTDGSNLASSSGESANFRSLPIVGQCTAGTPEANMATTSDGFAAFAHGLKGYLDSSADELAEARRLNSDGRYSSITQLRAVADFEVPAIRARFESTYLAGLRKAGMPEE
jgi:hypothetical protein